jgi:hypothetical protein
VRLFLKKTNKKWVVSGSCPNPNFTGSRDQDCDLKPAWANNFQNPISKKNLSHVKKRTDGMAQGVGPEFKPQYHKEKN